MDLGDPGKCYECGEPWEWVRPGKSQPTCVCQDKCPTCGTMRRHFMDGEIAPLLSGFLCPECDADPCPDTYWREEPGDEWHWVVRHLGTGNILRDSKGRPRRYMTRKSAAKTASKMNAATAEVHKRLDASPQMPGRAGKIAPDQFGCPYHPPGRCVNCTCARRTVSSTEGGE